jgi:phage portal protein BeeE
MDIALPTLARTAASLSTWLAGSHGNGLRLEPELDNVAGLAAERAADGQRGVPDRRGEAAGDRVLKTDCIGKY